MRQPRDLLRRELAHQPDLRLQVHPEPLLHPRPGEPHEGEHVGRGGAPQVGDEVGVFRGPDRVAYTVALETRRLDEPPGVVARGLPM